MNVLLRMFDERLGRPPELAGELWLQMGEWITARELIRRRLQEEVARHERALAERAYAYEAFHGLVSPVRAPGPQVRIDVEAQIAAACKAFETNGFFLLVDDHQVEDLDEAIALRPEVQVHFVRLVPLVGG